MVLFNLSTTPHNPPVAMPLWCAILGEKSSFPVAFDETEIVAELKDRIKETAGTTGLARTLTLY